MEIIMRKPIIFLLLLFLATGTALADIIYLKDGREVTGAFTGFENDQFTITDNDGNQLKFRSARVDRVVIDRGTRGRGDDARISQRGRWDERYDPINVGPDNAWVQSPIQVRSGQRVRVEATGTVTLDGRPNITPEGFPGQRSRNMPMPNQNAGALIARIGFNSPPLYVGSSGEIIADRDGILYFAVNYPKTAGSRGAFAVRVSLDRRVGDSATQEPDKTITIDGNQPWIDTGIDLEANRIIEIVTEGQIAYTSRSYASPEGNRSLERESYPVRNAGVGALIAKIRYRDGRESNPILIGSHNQVSTGQGESGRLFIGINDDDFRDNSGSYRVTIRNGSPKRSAVGLSDVSAQPTQRGEKTITVYANQAWTDTGIDFKPNMTVEILSEGQIGYSNTGNTGPNGGRNLGISSYPVRNAGVGAVIAKVRYRDGGESSPVFIGTSNQVNTDEYGRLWIGVNDDNFSDNKGSFRVTIRW